MWNHILYLTPLIALEMSDKEGEAVDSILSALDLHARPWKLQKYYLFTIGLQKCLDWRGATHSSIKALEVPFQVKLTKSQSWVKIIPKQHFSCFYVKPELVSDFCQLWPSLTQCWLLGAPKTLILIRLSEQIETNAIAKIIKFPFQTIHGLKLELKQLRYLGKPWKVH